MIAATCNLRGAHVADQFFERGNACHGLTQRGGTHGDIPENAVGPRLYEVACFQAEDGIATFLANNPYERLELFAVYALVVGLKNR